MKFWARTHESVVKLIGNGNGTHDVFVVLSDFEERDEFLIRVQVVSTFLQDTLKSMNRTSTGWSVIPETVANNLF